MVSLQAILQRRQHKVVCPARWDKLILAMLTVRLKAHTGRTINTLHEAIRIVQPETVLRWHREMMKVAGTGEIGEIVMRDRHRLSQDGFIVALIPVDTNNRLVGEPQIVSRGFIYLREAESLMAASCQEIKQHYQHGARKLQRSLEDFFYRETLSRPVVLPRFIRV